MNRRIQRRPSPIVCPEKKVIVTRGNKSFRDVYGKVKWMWNHLEFAKYLFPYEYQGMPYLKRDWVMLGNVFYVKRRRYAKLRR